MAQLKVRTQYSSNYKPSAGVGNAVRTRTRSGFSNHYPYLRIPFSPAVGTNWTDHRRV